MMSYRHKGSAVLKFIGREVQNMRSTERSPTAIRMRGVNLFRHSTDLMKRQIALC
jgi:hypothetical protein